MFMSRPPYALWSIWKQLSGIEHLFLLALCALCIYSVFSAVSIILGLRSFESPSSDEDIASSRHLIGSLRHRWANLRCLISAGLYLFGIVLFLSFQTMVVYAMGDAVEAQILGSFVVNCAFAANVIAIFLILHLVQWCVLSRLNSYAKRLS